MKLELHQFDRDRSHTGEKLGTGPVFKYAVSGMPQGQEASIANFEGTNTDSWRFLRVKDGVNGDWRGNYKTAEEALAVLQKEIDEA